MKVNDIINETTTSGSIASVSVPLSTQKRQGIGTGVYDTTKPGNLLTGKASKKKYANSLREYTGEIFRVQVTTDEGEVFTYSIKADNEEQALKKAWHRANKSGYDDFELKVLRENIVKEGKMKELSDDMKNIDNGNFKKKYGKSKKQMKFNLETSKRKTNESADYPQEVLDIVKKMKQAGLKHITGSRNAFENEFRLHAYVKEHDPLAGSINVEIKNGQVTKATIMGSGNISGPTNKQTMTFDSPNQDFDNLDDALKALEMINESVLEEEDKIITPGKGKKLKTGLHKPGKEKKLSHFKHPFKSSGIYVSDSRGNKVCECENEDVAKEVCKALNDYIKMDESKIHENVERVGAFNTKAGILKLLKSGYDPLQFFLINPKGEVVKQFRGTEDQVKKQVQQDIKSTIIHENKRKK